jgi:hypothetical protein
VTIQKGTVAGPDFHDGRDNLCLSETGIVNDRSALQMTRGLH